MARMAQKGVGEAISIMFFGVFGALLVSEFNSAIDYTGAGASLVDLAPLMVIGIALLGAVQQVR
jgi:hypothetical protein